jgi:hypothetical protein
MTTNRYTAADSSVIDTATAEVLVEFDPRLRGEHKATELAASLNLELGDVVEDSYGNPAVVIGFRNRGTRFHAATIMQTTGSDRGNVEDLTAYVRSMMNRLTEAQIESVRAIVRAESKRQGLKWTAAGLVN